LILIFLTIRVISQVDDVTILEKKQFYSFAQVFIAISNYHVISMHFREQGCSSGSWKR